MVNRVFARVLAPGIGLLMAATLACDGKSPTSPVQSAGSAKPSITGVTPSYGRLTGASVVTIHGLQFKAGATVTFGGVAAVVLSVDNTAIVVMTPPHESGTVDVVVTNPDGQTYTAVRRFMFAPPPSISSVTPDSGSTDGRTALRLNGSGFLPGAKVTIDGAVVDTFSNNMGTELYFSTRAHAAGPVDLVVINPDNQSTALSGGFTFAPAETFDFNGNWYAYLNDGNDFPFSFTVQNNVLVSLTCYEGTAIALPSSVTASHGDLIATVNGVVIFSARIDSPTSAKGTINAGLCHSQDWVGWKDQTGTARRGATTHSTGREK